MEVPNRLRDNPLPLLPVRRPFNRRKVNTRAIGARRHNKMHTDFLLVKVIDQNKGRSRDRVDIETQLAIDGFLRITREVLLDGVINTGKRSLGDCGAEDIGALLLDQDL